MIRKAVILALTLAAVGTVIAWPASYRSPVRSGDWPQKSAGHSVRIAFKDGVVFCTYQRREYEPLTPDEVDSLSNAHVQYGPTNFRTMGYFLRLGYVAYTLGSHSLEMDPPSREHNRIVSAYCPAWMLFIVLAAYPAIAFVRGPLRTYRRKKRALCLKCGYNLTGNVSGVCPECGTKVVRP